MKSKVLLLAFATAVIWSSVAQAKFSDIPQPEGMDYPEYLELLETGGYLLKPQSGYGKILYWNQQTRVPTKDLLEIKAIIEIDVRPEIVFSDKRIPAEITIEIVDSANEVGFAVYPDEKRAVVNVAPLAADTPDASKLAERLRKQLIRAFGFLGGVTGGVPGNLMDVMSDLSRLDDAKSVLPGAYVLTAVKFLERSGIRPWQRVTYADACQEGWAPQPTNDFQRAIWKKVHEPPSKPMKITYDKAAQKPVVK